jgi:hypothetical protein
VNLHACYGTSNGSLTQPRRLPFVKWCCLPSRLHSVPLDAQVYLSLLNHHAQSHTMPALRSLAVLSALAVAHVYAANLSAIFYDAAPNLPTCLRQCTDNFPIPVALLASCIANEHPIPCVGSLGCLTLALT